MGSGAKSYMRKGFLIYKEMRKYFTIHKEAFSVYDFAPIPLNFLIYEENFIKFFISIILVNFLPKITSYNMFSLHIVKPEETDFVSLVQLAVNVDFNSFKKL
jgi:hypothetical protein